MLQLDVTKASQRKILEELLAQDAVLYVHFAPPCGTASEARTIALSSSHHGPPPLRSLDKPMGLDNLTEHQRQRVETANYLYEWTCKIITDLHRRGVGWSVENPAGSLMWFTTPFVKLQAAISEFLAFSFHTCMFQAERKKDTAIWTSVPQLQSALERKCDGNHNHKPWGLVGPNEFATAEECAYNVELARTWAQAIADYAIACNVVPEPQTFDEARNHHAKTTKLNQALLGLLPRGRKIPPLMCDFLQPQTFDISEMPILQKLAPKMRIPDSVTAFPKGSRVLRFHSNGAGGMDGHESVDGQNTGLPKFAAIGIPREPWDFVAEAIKLVQLWQADLTLENARCWHPTVQWKASSHLHCQVHIWVAMEVDQTIEQGNVLALQNSSAVNRHIVNDRLLLLLDLFGSTHDPLSKLYMPSPQTNWIKRMQVNGLFDNLGHPHAL